MILPVRNEDVPTPERLAGVTVEIQAEENGTVQPYQQPQAVADPGKTSVSTPTEKELAGMYLHVEAPKDLAVRPATAAPPSGNGTACENKDVPNDPGAEER
jgi:hypothetical protein